MEKNFPFISTSWFDEKYENLVGSLTRLLDNGQVFKRLIVLMLHIISFSILIGGIWFCFQGMFGEYGYFTAMENVDGFRKFTSIIGFIIGLPFGLFFSWYGYSIVRKRAFQLAKKEYTSLLTFLCKESVPINIIITGELICIAAIMMGIMQFFSALLGALTYVPLMRLSDVLTGYSRGNIYILGDYDNFSGNLIEAGTMILGGLGIIIISYVVRDIYNYFYKIALSILNPILVFVVATILSVGFSFAVLYEFLDAGGELIMAAFVTIILIYILFMLLKKHVVKNWHENRNDKNTI